MRTQYRFGDFTLIVPDMTLRRGQQAVQLNRQSLEVLAHLLSNSMRVVTRDELIEKHWGRSPVGANVRLNTCMSRIRSALEEEFSGPGFICTLPRVGYQFIGDVDVRSAIAEPSPDKPTPQHRGLLEMGLAAAVVLAVLGTLPGGQEIGIGLFGARADSVYRNDGYRLEKFGSVSSSCNFDDFGTGSCKISGTGDVRMYFQSQYLGAVQMRAGYPVRCTLKGGQARCEATAATV